jgi:hypothetical protein
MRFMSMVCFESLPDEIIEVIFSYLSPRDLVSCSLLSKRLKSVADKDGLWRIPKEWNIPMRMTRGVNPKEFVQRTYQVLDSRVLDIISEMVQREGNQIFKINFPSDGVTLRLEIGNDAVGNTDPTIANFSRFWDNPTPIEGQAFTTTVLAKPLLSSSSMKVFWDSAYGKALFGFDPGIPSIGGNGLGGQVLHFHDETGKRSIAFRMAVTYENERVEHTTRTAELALCECAIKRVFLNPRIITAEDSLGIMQQMPSTLLKCIRFLSDFLDATHS